MKIIKTIYILFFVLIFASCKKTQNQSVPYVPVNITIYPSLPQYIKLTTIGGWAYVSGGSKGIIVYRKSNDEFMAYDRHCPYKVEDGCVVAIDSTTNIIVKDKCCNSQFILTDGSVSNGPATTGLLKYATTYNGNALTINN